MHETEREGAKEGGRERASEKEREREREERDKEEGRVRLGRSRKAPTFVRQNEPTPSYDSPAALTFPTAARSEYHAVQ